MLRITIRAGYLSADCTLDPRTERALLKHGWIRRSKPGELAQLAIINGRGGRVRHHKGRPDRRRMTDL